jgi:hypothetical protein
MNITKAGLARLSIGSYLALQYQQEMKENYRKGNWLEAAKDTAFFAVAMTPIVAPAFFFGTLAPVWIGLGVGVIATAVIVEATDIGTTQDVIDMVLDPPITDWYEVVAPEIEKKSDELQIRAVGWVDRRLMDVQHYLEQEYQEKKHQVETGWELLTKYGRWANPIALPF